MDMFVKYQSQQGGGFTSAQNLVDFNIPPSGAYDLSDSFVQFNYDLNVTEANDQGGTGVYDFNVVWKAPGIGNDATPHFDNVAFIKNSVMDCSSKGRIENIRRTDILRQNVKYYDQTRMEGIDESYINVNQIKAPIMGGLYGTNTAFVKEGVDKSQAVAPAPLQVRLSDVFEFCRAPEYDTDKAGQTNFHFELNIDKLEAREMNKKIYDSSVGNDGYAPEVYKFQDTDTVGAGNNSIVVGLTNDADHLEFKSLEQSPYYTGMKLNITAQNDGGSTPQDSMAVISAIDHDTTTGAVTLTFEQPWGTPLGAGQKYIDIQAVPAEATATISFTSAEMVLKRKKDPEGLDTITYNTYSTEETNGNGLTAFTNLYTVEPEANAVLIMLPQDESGLLSQNNNVESFRLRLNNEDLTDRDVVVKSPLYYDRLAMTLSAMGTSLSNTLENSGRDNAPRWQETYIAPSNKLLLVANPLFQTNQTKLLQVNLQSGGTGIKALAIFKQLPRVFTY